VRPAFVLSDPSADLVDHEPENSDQETVPIPVAKPVVKKWEGEDDDDGGPVVRGRLLRTLL
jgi:hypothetical protein